MNPPTLEEALRSLVASIYNDCKGAYGAQEYCYEGQYEDEIQDLVLAIKEHAAR